MSEQSLPEILQDLLLPNSWPHSTGSIDLIETHISWVLLTGDWAYKIKKPVNYGFVDFSTLEKRHHFCEEEIRINRPYSPGIYDRVVAICRDGEQLSVDGSGAVIEYAVRMHQFPTNAHLVDSQGCVSAPPSVFQDFGESLARSHEAAPYDAGDAGDRVGHHYGRPEDQMQLVDDVVAALEQDVNDPLLLKQLVAIKSWCDSVRPSTLTCLRLRRAEHRVRECHGDLHLGNLITLGDRLQPFDGLEFNPALRWTDVCADVAFLAMDLDAHGNPEASQCFLQGWLQHTGDYQALQVLRYFKIYRALVRARVAALTPRDNSDFSGRPPQLAEIVRYLALARSYVREDCVATLYVMRGLSGSGKSWLAAQLGVPLKAIIIRSDVERRRVSTQEGQKNVPSEEIDYSQTSRDSVYSILHHQASVALQAGYNVVLDATYLSDSACSTARLLAIRLNSRFLIVHTLAPYDVLVQRILDRQQHGEDASDATVAVLDAQCEELKPLSMNNLACEFRINTDLAADTAVDKGVNTQRIARMAEAMAALDTE